MNRKEKRHRIPTAERKEGSRDGRRGGVEERVGDASGQEERLLGFKKNIKTALLVFDRLIPQTAS